MKITLQIVFGALLCCLTALVPVSAFASKPPTVHTRTETYHDRTPKVHTHNSHPRRS